MLQGGRRWGGRVKQLQHLNKGLPDGFGSERAVNQVAAPTSFNADVKTVPEYSRTVFKDPHLASQASDEQPGDTWWPTKILLASFAVFFSAIFFL